MMLNIKGLWRVFNACVTFFLKNNGNNSECHICWDPH